MASPEKSEAITPLMKQYFSIKAKYPDALLLFRVGDFYETFGEDAVKTSKILGIVLTRRANGVNTFIELAGFPHHALDTYLHKLVRAGMRVAICDQLEDPKLAKTIVKRGITELVTPGLTYNDKIIEQSENNFLASVHLTEKNPGIAFLDVSTGEFYLAQGSSEYIDKLLQSFRPSEVILQRNKLTEFNSSYGDKFYTSTFDDWVFTLDFGLDLLLKHFRVTSLKGFGVESITNGIIAAGAALHYLRETHHDRAEHITRISRIEEDKYVWLDKFTIRNLELLYPLSENAVTFLNVVDKTITPMGSRLLKRWIALPLKTRKQIDERLDIVEYFIGNDDIAEKFKSHLKITGDLERIISKAAIGKISPRELIHLKNALYAVEEVKSLCMVTASEPLVKLSDRLNPCITLRSQLEKTLVADPPAMVSKGNVIAGGISPELDELRKLLYSGKDYLVQIQKREVENTGISSLKIAYNNVFGYYLEVTNTHKDKVPPDWIRKQTLTSAERYITPELKEYEQKIMGAEEKILQIENRLYEELVISVGDYIEPVQINAQILAFADVLLAFALNAVQHHYVRPAMDDSFGIEIKNGRHPVIETQLPPGESYIANDLYLDIEKQQIIVLTGPNMSGKSALLRQTALIVLMAQIGSYVPADAARIGVVDKIFTRVGASDNISLGESTFMVEMNETSCILNNISNRSLILLDELGRGTSTYDGISIAWAIAEYLHEHPLFKAKVLFATHYHELNEMARLFKRIKNYHISVKDTGRQVIFLRKLTPGGSEHSFGIHVAKMAGMPSKVIDRAGEVLGFLEQSHSPKEMQSLKSKAKQDFQLSFIQLDDPLILQIKDQILNLDINSLSPIEALLKLNEIKKMLEKK